MQLPCLLSLLHFSSSFLSIALSSLSQLHLFPLPLLSLTLSPLSAPPLSPVPVCTSKVKERAAVSLVSRVVPPLRHAPRRSRSAMRLRLLHVRPISHVKYSVEYPVNQVHLHPQNPLSPLSSSLLLSPLVLLLSSSPLLGWRLVGGVLARHVTFVQGVICYLDCERRGRRAYLDLSP
jgi:hypothetical protein